MIYAILGVGSYEGLPPEVGAFKSENGGHAPWPVHIFGHFRRFYANFRILGVGVIRGVSRVVNEFDPSLPWIHERFEKLKDES